MTETETISFREIVRGTDAERFYEEGYDILDLEWVEGGLKITAEEYGSVPGQMPEPRTPEEADRVRQQVQEMFE